LGSNSRRETDRPTVSTRSPIDRSISVMVSMVEVPETYSELIKELYMLCCCAPNVCAKGWRHQVKTETVNTETKESCPPQRATYTRERLDEATLLHLAKTLVVEAVDLCDLPRLVVSPDERDPVRVSHLGDETGDEATKKKRHRRTVPSVLGQQNSRTTARY